MSATPAGGCINSQPKFFFQKKPCFWLPKLSQRETSPRLMEYAKMKTKIKFVDVKKYGFIVEPRYFYWGWAKSPKILGRESVVKALIKTKRLLPMGYNFKIWDCRRSRKVNLAMLASFKRRIFDAYPKLSKKEKMKLVVRFGGPVPPPMKITRLDTHRNGGSFDLTIVNKNGDELYMGTDHDDLTEKAITDFFETKKKLALIEEEAKKNRRLLKKTLNRVGFKNYAAEWWHWSFDK